MKAFAWSILSVTVVSLALNTACGSKSDDKEETTTKTTTYTYTADTQAIINENCATSGCHGANPTSIKLTTLAEITPRAATMAARIRATGISKMPQNVTTFETSED